MILVASGATLEKVAEELFLFSSSLVNKMARVPRPTTKAYWLIRQSHRAQGLHKGDNTLFSCSPVYKISSNFQKTVGTVRKVRLFSRAMYTQILSTVLCYFKHYYFKYLHEGIASV